MSEARRPLISEPSDLSELSTTPTLVGQTPPLSPPSRSRPGYSRLRSTVGGADGSSPEGERGDEGDIGDTFERRGSSGLGIVAATTAAAAVPPGSAGGRRVSIQAVPRGVRSSPTISSAPLSSDPLVGHFPRYSGTTGTPDLRRERESPKEADEETYEEYRSRASKGRHHHQQYVHSHDTERLRGRGGPAPSIRSAYESECLSSFICTEFLEN
jgi:hypothetical protein